MGVVASPPWTPQEDARLRELAEAGRSVATIAERLKRSVSAVRNRANKFRIPIGKLQKRRAKPQ